MKNGREQLEKDLAETIAMALHQDIHAHGRASLLVSGGSTPKRLFGLLSRYPIEWEKVTISLVDERWVENNSPDQNGTLVRSTLLQNEAARAQFIPLVYNLDDEKANLEMARSATENLPRPFTGVLLGMGTDGHTASLFPEAPELDAGMELDNPDKLISVDPKTAPYKRITFTRKALLETKNLWLHLYGEAKRNILQSAAEKDSYRPYPIAAFLNQKRVRVSLFWSE